MQLSITPGLGNMFHARAQPAPGDGLAKHPSAAKETMTAVTQFKAGNEHKVANFQRGCSDPATTLHARREKVWQRTASCEGRQLHGALPVLGRGICDPAQGNAECAGDLVCPQEPNPDWFNGAPGEHRCIHPQCDELANELGCGYEGAPCGPNCCDRRACTSDADCTGGQVCGQRNGRFFGCRSERVCEDPICTTDPQTGGSGAEGAPCGDTCRCIPQCEGKVCGGDLNDGCDGTCSAVCQNGEVCQAHSECQPGSLCVKGAGFVVGKPGQDVCLSAGAASPAPGSCATPSVAPIRKPVPAAAIAARVRRVRSAAAFRSHRGFQSSFRTVRVASESWSRSIRRAKRRLAPCPDPLLSPIAVRLATKFRSMFPPEGLACSPS